MKPTKIITIMSLLLCLCSCSRDIKTDNKMEELALTFKVADNVRCEKVHFKNRFGIELTGDLYIPKTAKDGDKLPAIAISGPFGAVKEQASGYWANELASQGFITMAFDPSFTGESSGEPRYVSSPDINTEDFQAAVDYLMSRDDVDSDAIGLIGICGWGGIVLNVAALETRIKCVMAVTMYDMHRVTANGYFDASDSIEARKAMKIALNDQRNSDFASSEYRLAGGVVDPLPADAQQFVKDYYAYYKTPRGYAKNSLNSNNGWNKTSSLSWLNTPILTYADEIEIPVMLLHGEKAHSLYFSEDAYKKLTAGKFAGNKQLVVVPNANHCDLYDGGPEHNMIPWQTVNDFFATYLK